jgi:hypothetical protein
MSVYWESDQLFPTAAVLWSPLELRTVRELRLSIKRSEVSRIPENVYINGIRATLAQTAHLHTLTLVGHQAPDLVGRMLSTITDGASRSLVPSLTTIRIAGDANDFPRGELLQLVRARKAVRRMVDISHVDVVGFHGRPVCVRELEALVPTVRAKVVEKEWLPYGWETV